MRRACSAHRLKHLGEEWRCYVHAMRQFLVHKVISYLVLLRAFVLAVPMCVMQANINNVSEKEEELMVAQKKLANMKKEVLLKTKALQDRDNGLDIIHKTSMDVEVSCIVRSRSGLLCSCFFFCCILHKVSFGNFPSGLLHG